MGSLLAGMMAGGLLVRASFVVSFVAVVVVDVAATINDRFFFYLFCFTIVDGAWVCIQILVQCGIN